MSKQHPTILKKSDTTQRQQRQRPEPQQPKILTKTPSNDTNNHHQHQQQQQAPQKRDPDTQPEVHPMHACHRLLFPHFNVDPKAFDFLDNDNADFLVVAAVGGKNAGKSTLMNIIADQQYVRVHDDGSFTPFAPKHEVFRTRSEQAYEGASLDLFVTTDRVFVLDPSPLAHNVQRRDMIVAESDDLKLLLVLLQVCHLLVVVHAGHPDMTLLRLLHLADAMLPADVKHRPHFLHVGNNMQPGTRVKSLDDGQTHLMMPNLRHPSIALHHDVQQVVQDYQEQVFMLKRFSLMNDGGSEEVFNERKWSQRLLQVVEALKGDYFLRKYDGLRDKYHQAVDN
jgi:hypothetical protein